MSTFRHTLPMEEKQKLVKEITKGQKEVESIERELFRTLDVKEAKAQRDKVEKIEEMDAKVSNHASATATQINIKFIDKN